MKLSRFLQTPYITLFTKERALQDFDFPIAFCNGTRDYCGNTEGANTIVKNNRHYNTGRSQLFKLKNSGHNLFFDNPGDLTTYMIGFFNGTITHTFELHSRKEFTPDDNVVKEESSGFGKKLLTLGTVCAVAAGAYFYFNKKE